MLGGASPGLLRALPAMLAALMFAGFVLAGLSAAAPEGMPAQRWGEIKGFAEARPVAAGATFIGLYVGATLLLLPGVLWLTIGAGAAFGAPIAAALTWVSATGGATALFLLARTAIGGRLARRATGWAALLRDGFQRDAFKYLLSLRLLPFAPYFAVNLAPALLGVRVSTFALATAIGTLPGTILYALIGDGVATALEAGGPIDLSLARRPEIAGAFLAAAVAALAPVVWRAAGALRRKTGVQR